MKKGHTYLVPQLEGSKMVPPSILVLCPCLYCIVLYCIVAYIHRQTIVEWRHESASLSLSGLQSFSASIPKNSQPNRQPSPNRLYVVRSKNPDFVDTTYGPFFLDLILDFTSLSILILTQPDDNKFESRLLYL